VERLDLADVVWLLIRHEVKAKEADDETVGDHGGGLCKLRSCTLRTTP
jgi:hypothetical protein